MATTEDINMAIDRYADLTTVCVLDLAFEVPGGEIEVSTRLRDERLAANFRQFLMPQALAALHPWELALPVTVRIEESDRDVLVDDTPVRFTGVAIVEQGIWSGWALLPSCLVQINVRRGDPGDLAIALCHDVAAITDTY